MLAGRVSVYDNDYYLSATYPPALATDSMQLSPSQRASMSIMHVFVQCPRLNCLIRHAIMHPEDNDALAAAVTLTEYMWQIDLPAHVADLMQIAVTINIIPSAEDMAGVLNETLGFDSVQNMVLCTRYWMLQNVLCGLTDTLQRHFPTETNLSLLPHPTLVHRFDVDAGVRLAESLSWAEAVSQKLPLVPLRLHTPLQISIGPWHRTIRNTIALFGPDVTDQQASMELKRARYMKAWLIDKCNRIHEQWDVSTVDEKSLYEALDSMAGEKIPDWLPTRVRFEAEDGDMVIKLDYETSSGAYQQVAGITGSNAQERFEVKDYAETQSQPLDDKPLPSNIADFLFQNGRNVCSTSVGWPASDSTASEPLGPSTFAEMNRTFGPCTASSWWPQTPRSSLVLLDSTHKTSAFQPKARREKTSITFNGRKTNACMSPAWSDTHSSGESPTSSDSGSASTSILLERLRAV